jgi:tetratricopeptide (TPR) repeat protein
MLVTITIIWIGYSLNAQYYKKSQPQPQPVVDDYTKIVLDADYLRTNKIYNEAFDKYAEAINLDGNRAAAFIGRSGAYYDLGLYEKGIEDANKAVNLEPNNPDAYSQRAYGYLSLKRYAEAITDYQKCIDLNPAHQSASYSLSLAYFQISDYKNALAYINKAINANPDDFNRYLLRGQIYEKLDENRMARREYYRVLTMYPNHPEATQGLQRTNDKDYWSR